MEESESREMEIAHLLEREKVRYQRRNLFLVTKYPYWKVRYERRNTRVKGASGLEKIAGCLQKMRFVELRRALRDFIKNVEDFRCALLRQKINGIGIKADETEKDLRRQLKDAIELREKRITDLEIKLSEGVESMLKSKCLEIEALEKEMEGVKSELRERKQSCLMKEEIILRLRSRLEWMS